MYRKPIISIAQSTRSILHNTNVYRSFQINNTTKKQTGAKFPFLLNLLCRIIISEARSRLGRKILRKKVLSRKKKGIQQIRKKKER